MKKSLLTLPSSDGVHTLRGFRWEPESPARAVVQLVHGKSEHVARYEELAKELCRQGIAVIGHDHLGHGQTVKSEEELGYFGAKDGYHYLLKDIRRVNYIAKKLYPECRIFLLGHSMGSFLVRRYITIYPETVDGVILSGTGTYQQSELDLGLFLTEAYGKGFGPQFKSLLVDRMAMASLELPFGPLRRPGSWLSANEENAKNFDADPLCGVPFSVAGYHDLFQLIKDLMTEKNMDRVPRELPILLMSGMEDPLGGFTHKALDVYNRYVELGMKDVDIFFYLGDRHEIFNEKDADQVRADLIDWLERRIP